MDPPPPPPPPPHGANPKPTHRSGLPDGNYDIFIIPPHASGGGFLYLPSLQPNINSFIAGAAAAFAVMGIFKIIEPAAKLWFATVMASGGVGVIFLMLGVGVAGWAWGKTQTEGGPGGPGSGGADGTSAGGHAGPTPNGFPNGGGGYGPRQGAQSPGAGPMPGAGPGSWGAHSRSASDEWEQAEESRKREERKKEEENRRREEENRRKEEELRRKEEEIKRHREEENKRQKEEEDRKARAAAEKQKWEQKRQREKEQREREAREKQARERMEKQRLEREEKARAKEAKDAEEHEKLAAVIREQERVKAEAKAKADAKAAEEKKAKDRDAFLKQARERADRGRLEREAREAKAAAAGTPLSPPRPASTIGVGEKYAPAASRTASTPVSPSPRKPYERPSAASFVGSEYSGFRPYDTPATARAKTTATSSVSGYSESVSSYAASQSTARTTPPPSHRGPYNTADPNKIVIKGVYQFTSLFPKPTAQLVACTGNITAGLVLKISTEGLFIDDDVRGVAQREWDVRAWTMKAVETAEVKAKGCVVVRFSVKDSPTETGKCYVFVLGSGEAWKVDEGVKRLRAGSLNRGMKVEGMGQGEAGRLLGLLGWA